MSSESKISSKNEHARADAILSDELPLTARAHIRFVRRSLRPGLLDTSLREGQRILGSLWIDRCTRNIRHIHGLERIGKLDPNKSYICVANHRSFFDLYVVTGFLVHHGHLPHRILFPVRSNFFYDSWGGIFVNGVMSFFAMYPPVFRDRKLAHLNVASLDETVRLLKGPGVFVGLHPEGTRNKEADPYTLLPAQSGVGRIIHNSKAAVLPVFINGLGNDLPKQIAGNFTKKGDPIHVVFGEPIDFGGLLEKPSSPRVYKQIADRSLEVVKALGEEERKIRHG
jgi:1-acyl-sn-glycerol-3-phosphate acyltransferase